LTRPEDFELDPHEARRRTAQALMQLLTWQAAEHPVLVHLDDAQWLDADSAALLSFLVQEATPRTLIVIATRPKADDPLTEMVRRAKNSTDIVLEPLSVEDSETLARLMLERTGRESINPGNVARQSGGHPLFIHELVLHATRAEPVGSLEGAIATRLERLDESSRGLLDLVALADAPLPHPVALAASALRPDVYPWVLSTLRGENLVSFHALSSDDDVHAYHDRIRELVVQRMSPATRRDTHARLAQAIEECSPEALDALAHHFARAEQAEPAVRYARAAGENAIQKLAFEHAAALFRLALEHEREPRARGELEASLGHALASSGRGALAAEAYLRAASLAENFQALELQRRAGEQLLRAGHVEEGTHILFGMLRELGLAVPESDLMAVLSLMWTLVKLKLRGWKLRRRTGPLSARDRLRLDACWTVATGLSIVHHLRATEFQARALLLALNAGDADRVMKSTALLGATLGMADGVARTIGGGLRVRARELASTFPSDENTAWLELTQGVASMGDWDFAGCERLCAQAEATLRTRCQGAAWEVVTAQAFALWSATFRGNFATASLRLPALLASARSRGDRHAETALILSPVHLMGLCDDEPERVRLQCETSMAEWPSRLARFQHMCGAYVLAQVALYESRVDTAWEHVTYAWQMLRRGHLSRVQFQRIDLLGLRARTALGRAAAAEEALRTEWLGRAQADVRRLRKENAPAAFALADMVEGGAEHVVGNAAASISCLERAAQGFDALGMPLHAEVARLARGIVAKDELGRTRASKNLGDIGVVNPTRMMRLWIPGIA
jgi:tetratricopeptide (TPR) repeat protein